MGKRILQQRRGRGGLQFRAPSKGKIAPVRYPPFGTDIDSKVTKGRVVDILHEVGRAAPVSKVELADRTTVYLPAAEGLSVNSVIEIGPGAAVTLGNILPLKDIPEGTSIFNIEVNPGDGGKLIRAGGCYATVFSQLHDKTIVKLPSGKLKAIDNRCRATIGIVAGGGRKEKPFLKAGAKFYLMKTKAAKYPRVRGVAMPAVYHPFGGGKHQRPGKPMAIARRAPPGRKVGHVAPKKTGRKRIKAKSREGIK